MVGKNGKTKKKPGPKGWDRPTDAVLERYGKLGLNYENIADAMGIGRVSLKKYIERDGSILAAIKRGKAVRREEHLELLENIAKSSEPRAIQAKLTAIIFSLKMASEEALQSFRAKKLHQDIRTSKTLQTKTELDIRLLELEIRRLEGFEQGSNEVVEI